MIDAGATCMVELYTCIDGIELHARNNLNGPHCPNPNFPKCPGQPLDVFAAQGWLKAYGRSLRRR